ncbi:MAG: putative peptidyl-prolyl cis-trans isomerase [Leptospiraceae bacterium]|nr:putative peptidyl-prolyl cis-trans isomerase [Leptospiraceae bacterium]MCP5500648.1 putative peptidyl-prolyl cis-trans isomerase [Leptospiraceae bacterium]
MQKKLFYFLLLFLLIPSGKNVYPGDSLNSILAIVGSVSITKFDYEDGLEKYEKLKKFMPDLEKKKEGSIKSRVLDFLIMRAIVDLTADEETIQVNKSRIEGEIQKRMELMQIDDPKKFEQVIESQTGLPYDLWVGEIPFQIKKAQLMQIRIPTQLPNEEEIQDWYNKNKTKVGFEMRYREIALVPNGSSIKEEQRIFKDISNIYKKVRGNRSAFISLASSSQNESKLYHGLMDWSPAFEIFNKSKVIASVAARMGIGTISEVFRDEKKRYCILLLEGKRPTPLEHIRTGIQNILYREKEDMTFARWIEQRRKEINIQIFDSEYLNEHGLPLPSQEFVIKDSDE